MLQFRCESCGIDLQLDKFAYHQNRCWDCFKRDIYDAMIILDISATAGITVNTFDKSDIDRFVEEIRFMLDCLAEVYHEDAQENLRL